MLTADDFRGLALDMDGVIEGAHMGHPDFRANGRRLRQPARERGLGHSQADARGAEALMHEHPRMFTPAAGAWGRQG